MLHQARREGGARGAPAPPKQTAEVHFFVKKWGPGCTHRTPPPPPPQTAEVHFFSDRTPPPP